MTAVLPDATVTASFMGGKLSGSAGCNRYFGNYNTGTEHQLSISTHIGATMMACAPPVAEQERQYLDRLPVVVAFQLEGSSLRLLDKDQRAVLEYSAIKPAYAGRHALAGQWY